MHRGWSEHRSPRLARGVRLRVWGLILPFVALALPAGSTVASASTPARADPICNYGFPGASERTVGNTTYDNRQLSVFEVLCTDFGKSSGDSPTGGIFCTLYAAAVGEKFPKEGLYIDGACAAKSVETHDDPAGVACGGLVSLVGAVADLAPELKAYALGAGVACDTGHSLGPSSAAHLT